jgi:hypothetical protein
MMLSFLYPSSVSPKRDCEGEVSQGRNLVEDPVRGKEETENPANHELYQ